jgi:hypothetical protein
MSITAMKSGLVTHGKVVDVIKNTLVMGLPKGNYVKAEDDWFYFPSFGNLGYFVKLGGSDADYERIA